MEKTGILIPCFNAFDTIDVAVASVLRQSCPDWEILLIADDGHDYAAHLAALDMMDPRIKFLATSQPGSGPAKARNLGIDCAETPFIALLDADDVLSPNFLACTAPLARTYGAALSNYTLFGPDIPARAKPMFAPVRDGLLMLTPQDCARLVFTPKPVFKKSLGIRFDETQKIGEITHCVFDLLDALGALPVATEASYHYRVHTASIFGQLHANPDLRKPEKTAWMDSAQVSFRRAAVGKAYRDALIYKSALKEQYLEACSGAGSIMDYRFFIVANDHLAYRPEGCALSI